jgi:hypothetical protein
MRSVIPDSKGLTDRMFYENKGQIAVSVIFGLAIAFLFKRVCKDRKCIVIQAPLASEVSSKIYQFEGECFKYKPYETKCPEDEKDVVKSV